MKPQELELLQQRIATATQIAQHFGLDFPDVRFEILPATSMYAIAAAGMPNRFAHWSFGKAFSRMKMMYDLGLSKIYELVINADPTYAFLLENNSVLENTVVAAHVLAHADFFHHNRLFAPTRPDMPESMAQHAKRLRDYEERFGEKTVSDFLDAGLSIADHVLWESPKRQQEWFTPPAAQPRPPHPHGRYDDLLALGEPAPPSPQPAPSSPPYRPVGDLLWAILQGNPRLLPWQKDVLEILREESLYFWPQRRTKIMNEGWAALWHARILREMDLDEQEAIAFAKMHAAILAPSGQGLNPYRVGMLLFEAIEDRFDHPGEEEQRQGIWPGSGREKIFEVREVEDDLAFIRNWLDASLIRKGDLFLQRAVDGEQSVVDIDPQRVKQQLLLELTHGGVPVIEVEEGGMRHDGSLQLVHRYEGVELELSFLQKTLQYIEQLWGGPVYLQTVLDNKPVCFTCENGQCSRSEIPS